MRRWFLPETPDLTGLLVKQGETTAVGMEAFEQWSAGDPGQGAAVWEAEQRADVIRAELLREIRRAFVTPVNPEDIFELSERLDGIMNAAKDIVRETELLDMTPDAPMAEMARILVAGAHDLVEALAQLTEDPDKATAAADAASHRQRELEHVYRRAMSALLSVDELREVGGRRELYRRYARMGDTVRSVADRVWYAVVKEG